MRSSHRDSLPKTIPISSVPPIKHSLKKITVSSGDLVCWKEIVDNKIFFRESKVGLVLEVRWALMDWMRISDDSLEYYAEAVIRWDNGDITMTSVDSVKILKKPVQPKSSVL